MNNHPNLFSEIPEEADVNVDGTAESAAASEVKSDGKPVRAKKKKSSIDLREAAGNDAVSGTAPGSLFVSPPPQENAENTKPTISSYRDIEGESNTEDAAAAVNTSPVEKREEYAIVVERTKRVLFTQMKTANEAREANEAFERAMCVDIHYIYWARSEDIRGKGYSRRQMGVFGSKLQM